MDMIVRPLKTFRDLTLLSYDLNRFLCARIVFEGSLFNSYVI